MNILTFDIEEWFHILDNDSTKSEKEWSNFEYRLDSNMDRIFEMLDRKDQKATFFVLGWVAREFPHIVKKIHELGFEIATHSDKHQLAYNQTRKEFSADLDFSIKSIEETKAYLKHPVLGERLIESCKILLTLEDHLISEVMGFPDDLKLKSSMTLFEYASSQNSIFSKVLNIYYEDERDKVSLEIIKRMIAK